MNFALREAGGQIFANGLDIPPDVKTLDIRGLIQLLVHPRYGADAKCCVLKALREFRLDSSPRLKAKHADDQRKAILDAMVHLLDEKLLPLQSRLQMELVTFTLDRHPQDVGGALEKREIMLDEVVI